MRSRRRRPWWLYFVVFGAVTVAYSGWSLVKIHTSNIHPTEKTLDMNLPPPTTSSTGSTSTPVFQEYSEIQWMYHSKGDFHLHDAFSGMWWMPKSKFLELNPSQFTTVESTSQMVFRQFAKDLIMTRDWLDGSIEHMSKWWKQLYELPQANTNQHHDTNDPIRQQVVAIFDGYLQRAHQDIPHYQTLLRPTTTPTVPQRTVVLLAYLAPSSPKDESTYQKALTATLWSLQRVGMGRAVVVGTSPKDPSLVQASFEELTNLMNQLQQMQDPKHPKLRRMSVSFCTSTSDGQLLNTTTNSMKTGNVPKAAIQELQRVLQQAAANKCWLGHNNAKDFDYVYLTEPDLMLQTRPSAIVSMSKKLQEGYVIAAHRFQPIPHYSDIAVPTDSSASNETTLASWRRWILPPTTGIDVWANVTSLNSSQDACCDAGNHHVGLMDFSPCPGKMPSSQKKKMWWQCGFGRTGPYETDADLLRKHKRLLSYRSFRVQDGTRVTIIGGANGRACLPQPRGRGKCSTE